MDVLNSSWLMHMMNTSAKKPADQLLSIYSCLNFWMLVPGVREIVAKTYSIDVPLMRSCPVLTAHLIKLAGEAKLVNPTIFVTQMFLLLQGAISEELRSPGTGALLKAQDAAKAIMKDMGRVGLSSKKSVWVLSSSFAMIVLAGSLVYLMPGKSLPVEVAGEPPTFISTRAVESKKISPDLIVKVLVLKEHFDAGNCPAPHLLTMNQDQVAAYMDVVNYRDSENPAMDSERLRTFLNWYDTNRAWECYFTAQNQQKVILGMGRK